MNVWEVFDVGDEVRQQRELVSKMDSLYERFLLRDDVLADLGKDGSLDEDARKFALEVAELHSEDPQLLTGAAWRIVKTRGASKDNYTQALRYAERAVGLAPRNGYNLFALGVVQYRLGRYNDALASLTKSEKLNTTKEGSLPADLAFLAMTQHQLGKKDEAKAALGRLRAAMNQPRWANDAESVSLLREAEELIGGKAGDDVDSTTSPARSPTRTSFSK